MGLGANTNCWLTIDMRIRAFWAFANGQPFTVCSLGILLTPFHVPLNFI